MMRRSRAFLLPVWAAVLLAVAARAAETETKYELKVVTDRPDAIYAVGRPAQFMVTVTRDGKPVTDGEVSYKIDQRGFPPVLEGRLKLSEQPAAVKATLDKPGFLLCRVQYAGNGKEASTAMIGAVFDPEKIPPSMPAPDDFDEFWTAQKARLEAVPMDPKLTPVESPTEGIACFDLELGCVPPRPVRGYYARPIGSSPRSLPAILHVHSAGVHDSNLKAAASAAREFHALSLDINAHGIPNGRPAEYYTGLNKGELAGYRQAGREDREKCYFLGMFLRVARAIDFLASQPEWDGRTLIVEGGSQGGGQAIAAAGLDSRVSFIAAGVPAICDHTGMVVGRPSGWPKSVPMIDGKPDEKVVQAMRYFDGVNFAGRTKAEAWISVGFVDPACPPSAVFATYNNLGAACSGPRSPRHMVAEPAMGHSTTQRIKDAFRRGMAEHIAAMNAKSK